MNTRTIFLVFAAAAIAWRPAGTTAVAADPPVKETSDQKFEGLLAAALKDPEKADWKMLRRAFSKTTRYKPYSVDVDEKLKGIARAIGRGEFKESEAALLELIDKERSMRVDSLAMLMMLYQKTGQPEKEKKYRALVGGILGVLEYPKAGVSVENPIEVLFVQEEYLVTTGMAIKGQAMYAKNGHRYDVLTIKAEAGEPEKQVYFNIDMLRNALAKAFEGK